MNALAHCVEAVWSPRRTPEAEAIAARRGAADGRGAAARRRRPRRPHRAGGDARGRRARRSVPAERGDGRAPRARPAASAGAPASPTGSPTPCSSPHSIRFNADGRARRGRAGSARPSARDDAAGAVAALVERLGIPTQLGDCGVTLDDVEAVAQLAPSQRQRRRTTPVPVTRRRRQGHPCSPPTDRR